MRTTMLFGGLATFLTFTIGSLVLTICYAKSDDKDTSTAQRIVDPLAAEKYGRVAAEAGSVDVEHLIKEGSADTWACASCHGEKGQGTDVVPRLAGLSAGYITKQLHDYAEGRRVNGNMQFVVESLDDQQMAALGRYYAELEPPSNAKANLGGDLERGRELAQWGDWSIDVPACFSCHGSSGWGVGQAFPGLAAQHPSYVYTQLLNWQNGRRVNSPVQLMEDIAKALSDSDMRAVADYFASLTPPQQITSNNPDGVQ